MSSPSYPETPAITSFVLRFVQEETGAIQEATGPVRRAFRGTIRHVQTDEEVAFVHWADAVAFISRFIQLELED